MSGAGFTRRQFIWRRNVSHLTEQLHEHAYLHINSARRTMQQVSPRLGHEKTSIRRTDQERTLTYARDYSKPSPETSFPTKSQHTDRFFEDEVRISQTLIIIYI